MKKLTLEQMEKIEGGKFWGTGCDYSNPINSGIYEVGEVGGGHYEEFCEYQCYYYVFGISTGPRGTTLGACPSLDVRNFY